MSPSDPLLPTQTGYFFPVRAGTISLAPGQQGLPSS